jgi:hypothetical protein
MATNHYFQGGNGIGNSNEKRLYEDLIIEGLKIYGHDCYYLPRTLVNRDLILGEDTLSRFDDSYLLEMYMETTEGFAGEQEVINKFGLDIREDTTFCISKRRWQNQVDSAHTMIVEGRPNEGDIIYFPLMDSFFEIQFVQDQEPFFQLGQLPVYKLRCTRWEYSSQELNTGVEDIDMSQEAYSLDQGLHQTSLDSGTFGLQIGTPVVTNDAVASIPIISGGEEYKTAPTLTITAPTIASLRATVTGTSSSGTLTALTITNPGRGYGSTPEITITYLNPAFQTKTLLVTALALTNGKLTSITLPTLTGIGGIVSVVVSPPGGAVTAAATATLTNGVVTSININVGGSSYDGTVPTVTISENLDAEGALQLENDSGDGEEYYFINEDYSVQEQSGYADNLDLDKDAGFDTASTQDDILDFTERNPFGDPDGGGY